MRNLLNCYKVRLDSPTSKAMNSCRCLYEIIYKEYHKALQQESKFLSPSFEF